MFQRFLPKNKSLVALDSMRLNPVVLVIGTEYLDDHAQRIANATGATCLTTKIQTLCSFDQIIELHKRNRKIGCVGFQDQGLALTLVSRFSLTAVSSFGGVSFADLRTLPLSTLIQLHFPKGHAYSERVMQMDNQWKNVISNHGGYHSMGFHSLEENVYWYEELDLSSHSQEANLAWSRLFGFLIKHLKEI